MHAFMKAVGFSGLENRKDLDGVNQGCPGKLRHQKDSGK